MTVVHLKITREPEVGILCCAQCDTAMLPAADLPQGGPAALRCPLCGQQRPVEVVEVGGDQAFHFNPAEQQEDALASPLHLVESIGIDEDLVLVDVPTLLEEPAFVSLQDGVAPVVTYGWVGGTGLLGSEAYRLFLVVRVDAPAEEDLFRIEFPALARADLSAISVEKTVVLVSQKRGVFCPEAGEVYLEALKESGAKPGDAATLNLWVDLEEQP